MVAKLSAVSRPGLLLFFIAASSACSASAPKNSAGGSASDQDQKSAKAPPLASPEHADAVVAEGPSASEIEARSLLNRLFREAGLRIVNDRSFAKGIVDVTLDGFDPERGIGYEYIARSERGTDFNKQEMAALAEEPTILVLRSKSLDEVEAEALAFLSALATSNPEP